MQKKKKKTRDRLKEYITFKATCGNITRLRYNFR